jgi:spore germination protein GerM
MRNRTLALAALLLVALVVAAGCGSKGGKTTPATSPKTTPSTAPAPVSRTTVSLFFTKGATVSQLSRETNPVSVEQALTLLMQGPSETEKAQGFGTAIPAGTKLQAYRVDAGKATVDFSKEMLNFGGGSATVQAITSQVDNTVTSNDSKVKTVAITIDGKPAEEVLQP